MSRATVIRCDGCGRSFASGLEVQLEVAIVTDPLTREEGDRLDLCGYACLAAWAIRWDPAGGQGLPDELRLALERIGALAAASRFESIARGET